MQQNRQSGRVLNMESLIKDARIQYHKNLLNSVLTIDSEGIVSNADRSNAFSKEIARKIVEQLEIQTSERMAGQTSGKKFEEINTEFIKSTFPKLQHIRPGDWIVERNSNANRSKIANYEQYKHLIALTKAANNDPELAAALGRDYIIAPDTLIVRNLLSEAEINKPFSVVSDTECLQASLREKNGGCPILHASISSKWTIRSDRSQNSRSEALNLIRNRKGHLPHIVVITGEPLPSRISSIALGTGDIDCVYHFALYELKKAINDSDNEEAIEMLNIMINGNRLKDISDLPLDLSV